MNAPNQIERDALEQRIRSAIFDSADFKAAREIANGDPKLLELIDALEQLYNDQRRPPLKRAS